MSTSWVAKTPVPPVGGYRANLSVFTICYTGALKRVRPLRCFTNKVIRSWQKLTASTPRCLWYQAQQRHCRVCVRVRWLFVYVSLSLFCPQQPSGSSGLRYKVLSLAPRCVTSSGGAYIVVVVVGGGGGGCCCCGCGCCCGDNPWSVAWWCLL